MKIKQIPRTGSEFQQPLQEQAFVNALKAALPGEQIQTVTEIAGGLYNNTFNVSTASHEYILKVAPVAEAPILYHEQYLMQREQSLAPHLTKASQLIPQYLSFFQIDNRCAFLQHKVQGQLWFDVSDSLTASENQKIWYQLGEFAHTLHQIEGESFGYPQPFRGFAKWSDFIADNIEGFRRDCEKYQVLLPEVDTFVSHLPRFASVLDEVTSAKLLHGDIWPRNVLIDGDGEDIHITAVIDAERGFWGDPISEWVLLLFDVPEAFWTGYGENLLQTSHPAKLAIYQGMYFLVNLLEAKREWRDLAPAIKDLATTNHQLSKFC